MATRNTARTQRRDTRTDRRSDNRSEPRPYKVVYGIVDRGEKGFWTRIGAAFENRDGSLNILLDFLPTSVDTTLQIREPRERDEE